MSEGQLQADVFQYFWNTYPETRRLLFHVPNGGTRNKVEAVKLRGQGVVKGVPDLIGLSQNFFAIELKVPGGILGADQKKVHDLWRSKGYTVHVCWSYDEAVATIKKEFGI